VQFDAASQIWEDLVWDLAVSSWF